VSDGDTFSARVDGALIRVRIASIDAPEANQDFGAQARLALVSALGAGRIELEIRKYDRYGRTVARVTVDGVDVGLRLIRNGVAWHYTRFQDEQSKAERDAYRRAETEAKRSRVGLWASGRAVAPWDFRNGLDRSDAPVLAIARRVFIIPVDARDTARSRRKTGYGLRPLLRRRPPASGERGTAGSIGRSSHERLPTYHRRLPCNQLREVASAQGLLLDIS
jgi:endonuclease YncB( thermonuclease family)